MSLNFAFQIYEQIYDEHVLNSYLIINFCKINITLQNFLLFKDYIEIHYKTVSIFIILNDQHITEFQSMNPMNYE